MSAAYFFLSGVCHQLPAHCLHYQGRPLPLCARCMGIFVGVLISLLSLAAAGQGRRSQLPPAGVRILLFTFVGLWALDGINSFVETIRGSALLYEPSNALRLATGTACGLALGIVLYPIYHYAIWRCVDERRVLDREGMLLIPLSAGALFLTVAWFWSSAPFALWLVLATASVVAVLSLVNALLLALLKHPRGFVDRPLQILPYLALGFAAFLLETGALALLRRLLVQ